MEDRPAEDVSECASVFRGRAGLVAREGSVGVENGEKGSDDNQKAVPQFRWFGLGC